MPPQTLFAAITPKALVVASHAAATVFFTATAVALLLLLLLLAMPGAAVADVPVEPARPIPWNVAVAALATK